MEYLIIKTIYQQYGKQATNRSCEIVRMIRELQPGKPDDETQGFIAYNMPNKDRMKMKTGRFLTRKLHLNNGFLSDTAIQRLASEINTELFPSLGIRLDTGEAIYDNYYNDIGGSSCMTGSCADYVRLYCDNEDQISQLVIVQNGDSARAIIWKLDNGRYFMDRIYATCGYLQDRLRDYAKHQGWDLRDNDDMDCSVPSDMVVSGLAWTDGEVPYMDSLRYYRIEDGLLTVLSNSRCSDGTLDSQDGTIENQDHCCNCNTSVDEDDIYSNDDSEIYCEDCYNDIYSYCEKCEETVLRDDIVCVDGDNYWCKYCADSHATQCEKCSEYVTTSITVDGDEYCEDCAQDFPICEDCGEYTEEVNQCGYCEDCEPDHEDEIPCAALTGQLFKKPETIGEVQTDIDPQGRRQAETDARWHRLNGE